RGDAGGLGQLEVLAHQERDPGDCRVRRLQPGAGTDIGADRRRRQAEQPRAVERVAQRLADAAEAAHLVVVGHAERRRHRPFHPRRVVVTQVLAHAFELVSYFDADRLQPPRVTDAGELQQLRRVNRAGADDHFAGGARFALLAMHVVAHADAALAVEQQAFGQSVGDDGQVRPGAGGIEVAYRGAHTATPANGRLGHADTVLLSAVVVLGVG